MWRRWTKGRRRPGHATAERVVVTGHRAHRTARHDPGRVLDEGHLTAEVGQDRRQLTAGVGATDLAAHAASRAQGGLYLQVEDTNEAGRALYHRTGFTDHHSYHYRVAPAGEHEKLAADLAQQLLEVQQSRARLTIAQLAQKRYGTSRLPVCA